MIGRLLLTNTCAYIPEPHPPLPVRREQPLSPALVLLVCRIVWRWLVPDLLKLDRVAEEVACVPMRLVEFLGLLPRSVELDGVCIHRGAERAGSGMSKGRSSCLPPSLCLSVSLFLSVSLCLFSGGRGHKVFILA